MADRGARHDGQQDLSDEGRASLFSNTPTLGELHRLCGRQNNFTLIRVVLAAAVIYGHSYALSPRPGRQEFAAQLFKPYNMYSGSVAVLAFFLVSGFLVAASLVSRGSVIQFLKARVLRIYPGLAVCILLLTFVLGPLATQVPKSQYFSDPQILDFLKHNLTLLDGVRFYLPGVFQQNPVPAVNGSLWSLPVEVKLYLVLSLLGLLGILRSRAVTNVVVFSLVVAWILKPARFDFLIPGPAAPGWALMFAIGVLLYLNRDSVPLNKGILGAFFFIAVVMYGTDRFPIAFGAFLAYATFWVAYVPKLSWPEWLGDNSYGIYIYGYPVQQAVKCLMPSASPLTNTAVALPITFLIALASWHYVEKPALSLKDVRLVDLLARISGGRWKAVVEPTWRRSIAQVRYRVGKVIEQQYLLYKTATDAESPSDADRHMPNRPHFPPRDSVSSSTDRANASPDARC